MQNVALTNHDSMNLALKYLAEEKYKKAKSVCKQILRNEPQNAGCLALMGNICTNLNELPEAEKLFCKALGLEAGGSMMYIYISSLLANVYKKQSRTEEALRLFAKSVDLYDALGCPAELRNTGMFFNYGLLLRDLGKADDAIAVIEKFVATVTTDAGAYYLLGLLYNDKGKKDKALYYLNVASSINPKKADYYFASADILKSVNRHKEAQKNLLKILEYYPDNERAYSMLADIEMEAGHTEKAIEYYRKSLSINPDYEIALNALYYMLGNICAWDEKESFKRRVEAVDMKRIRAGQPPYAMPLSDIMEHIDPARNLQFAKSYAAKIAKRVESHKQDFSFEERKNKSGKINIAYISGDFRKHAMFFLTNNMFKYHDREKFSVTAYSLADDPYKIYREKIKQDCDNFVDISKMNNIEAARKIYNDGIDILIDLTGFTATARPDIAALRPAPLQLHYLGFIGSSGADWYDYIITDEITTPAADAPYYTEKFLYMPSCYQVNDNESVISQKNFKRSDFGLPEDKFVFCCFNQAIKIDPVMFACWMRILQRSEDSVLWLLGKGTEVEANLRKQAEKHEIAADRLIFADRMSEHDEYLERTALADIALDTRIYNGGTITSNMLWAGVPVITMTGGHFASRMASSIIKAVGLDECVTASIEEYEELAVALASDKMRSRALRDKLKENIPAMPLFDTKGFVQGLDEAYLKVWGEWQNGEMVK